MSLPLSRAGTGWTPAADRHPACCLQICRYRLLKAVPVSAAGPAQAEGMGCYEAVPSSQEPTLPETVLKASSYLLIWSASSHFDTSPFFQSSTLRCNIQNCEEILEVMHPPAKDQASHLWHLPFQRLGSKEAHVHGRIARPAELLKLRLVQITCPTTANQDYWKKQQQSDATPHV